MKHKLSVLSVILALLALVLVFTACGDSGNITSEGLIKPRTITIYSITDDSTTPDAIQMVQDSLNKITESLYKVHVVLKFFPESEYEEALRAAVFANEMGDVIINQGTSDSEDAPETVVNEYGRPLTVFPEAVENQLDIFLIPEGVKNFDKYTQAYDLDLGDGAIITLELAEDLTSHLNENGSAYVLNQYIPAKVLDFCRADSIDSSSALLGIPSNTYYGDAEYMLINKELFDKYNYDPSIITDMYSVKPFLVDLATACRKGTEDAIPLYNTPNMNLVSVTGRKSVVAQCVNSSSLVSSGKFTPQNIFSLPDVQKAMDFVSSINVAGGIMPRVTENIDFNTKFGAAYVFGSAEVYETYGDDYYVIQTSIPTIDGDELYKGVYAVSTYASEYADRCMEVITCMTTNAEFRNLLGYGIENTNYIIDEESKQVIYSNATQVEVKDKETGAVTVKDLTYKMDLEKTGNMFLLMQNENMTEKELSLSANNWANAKATNNSAVVSPYAKFIFNQNIAADRASATYAPMAQTVPELDKLYDEIWIWISEFPTYVDPKKGEKFNTFTEYIQVLRSELDKNLFVSSAFTLSVSSSLRSQYDNWWGIVYGDNPS